MPGSILQGKHISYDWTITTKAHIRWNHGIRTICSWISWMEDVFYISWWLSLSFSPSVPLWNKSLSGQLASINWISHFAPSGMWVHFRGDLLRSCSDDDKNFGGASESEDEDGAETGNKLLGKGKAGQTLDHLDLQRRTGESKWSLNSNDFNAFIQLFAYLCSIHPTIAKWHQRISDFIMPLLIFLWKVKWNWN